MSWAEIKTAINSDLGIPLNKLINSLINTNIEEKITASKTWISPITGWVDVEMWGAGGKGGMAGYFGQSASGAGGASGQCLKFRTKVIKGSSYSVNISTGNTTAFEKTALKGTDASHSRPGISVGQGSTAGSRATFIGIGADGSFFFVAGNGADGYGGGGAGDLGNARSGVSGSAAGTGLNSYGGNGGYGAGGGGGGSVLSGYVSTPGNGGSGIVILKYWNEV